MKKIIITAALVFMFFAVNKTNGQDKWKVEFRTAAAFAVKELGNTNLNTGIGFEGIFSYRFMPHLAAYTGWEWRHFGSKNSLDKTEMDFEETGYNFGLQFIHPSGISNLNYLLRAGGIYNHIETENSSGDIFNDSKHGLGWELEAGVEINLNNSLRLRPSVRYHSLSRDIEVNNLNNKVDLNYFSVGVGLSVSL